MSDYIYHHGIPGQKWGVRNGPPYPLSRSRKNMNGYSHKNVQDFYNSYPKSDKHYGIKHKNYEKTIYRNMVPKKGVIEMYKTDYGDNIASIAIDVHPDYRGQGVGKKLVNDAKKNMDKLKVDRLEWYCEKSNKPSVALAKSCGFNIDKNLSTKDWYTLYYDKNEDFDPFKVMDKIDKSLSKKEQNLLGVGNNESTDDMKFFFNKDKTAYLLAVDYHGKYKDEHPIDGKILGIAAMPQARGTGATDKLISDAKKEFKDDRLVAEIDQGNTASKKLFERNDFKKIMEENDIDYYIYDDRKSKLIHGFLCEIELNDQTLTHYGVKGMKWRYRKRSGVNPNSAYGRLMARNDIESLVDRAKLVGNKGKSSSSKTSKAKGAGKKAAAGSKAAKKETEKKSAATTNPLQERIESIKKQKIDKDYISALKNNLSRDRSQLPKAREKAIELEKRRKKR